MAQRVILSGSEESQAVGTEILRFTQDDKNQRIMLRLLVSFTAHPVILSGSEESQAVGTEMLRFTQDDTSG